MKMTKWALLAGAVLIAGTAVLAGCSKSSGTKEGAAGPGELADEALVTYKAADGSYSFQHPQSWTETTDAKGNVRFAGRDAFVGVEVRSGAGADLTALAAACGVASCRHPRLPRRL